MLYHIVEVANARGPLKIHHHQCDVDNALIALIEQMISLRIEDAMEALEAAEVENNILPAAIEIVIEAYNTGKLPNILYKLRDRQPFAIAAEETAYFATTNEDELTGAILMANVVVEMA